ncbi:MAG: DUF3048 C-terminal domain-containing protein [Oscillospiraceae bacterium]
MHFHNQTTSFTYDAGTKLYTGAQYGRRWVDGNDGTALTFRNLLVLGAETKTIDDYGRLAVTLTGKGEGHLIRDGQCVPITWSREKEDMPFTYTFADGSPATLAAGKTYVAVVPPGEGAWIWNNDRNVQAAAKAPFDPGLAATLFFGFKWTP